jgi:Flp pilus assembly protein TadG
MLAKIRRSERGVEVVEMALILPVLILICFGVVDLLRLSYFESMLERTTSDIAVHARHAPNLDYDLREFTTNSGEYNDFLEGRKRAIDSGLSTSSTAFTQPGVPSDAQLIGVTQVDDSLGNYTVPPPPFVGSAAILRPGEQATFSYTDSSGNSVTEVVKHPLIPPDAAGRVPPQKMDALLNLSPIHVEMRAIVRPLLFFVLGDRIVRGSSTTYREKGIRRTIMVDSAGNDMAPATATRRTETPETWLTSPEPVEPPVTCVPGGSWTARWASAFANSATFGQAYVVNTKDPGPGMCPNDSVSALGGPGL